MAEIREVLPACPWPTTARFLRFALSYTFTGLSFCVQASEFSRNHDSRTKTELQGQPATSPAKPPMLAHGGRSLNRAFPPRPPPCARTFPEHPASTQGHEDANAMDSVVLTKTQGSPVTPDTPVTP